MTEITTNTENNVEKDWVLMLYLAGDNNLSEDMAGTIRDLGNMNVEVPEVAVMVYYDSAYPQIRSRYQDFTPKLTSNVNGFSSEPDCEFIEESNTADPESLTKFVAWCNKRYKSKNYALFLSGHSDGFQGLSLFRDDESKSVMTLRALKDGLLKINQIIGRKLQILGFDGCVMSNVEIAYEFRNVANIMVSSQGFIPDAGLNYSEMLKRWNDLQAKTPEEFAGKAIEVYLNEQKGYDIGGRSVTLSACRLSEQKNEKGETVRPIEDLEEKINELSGILYDNFAFENVFNFPEGLPQEELIPQLLEKFFLREQLKKVMLSSQWDSQTLLFEQAVDIKDFCERLKNECSEAQVYAMLIGKNIAGKEKDLSPSQIENLKKLTKPFTDIFDKCDEIIKEYDYCIIRIKDNKPVGAEYQFATGLSLFFPWSSIGYGISESEYNKTEFCQLNKEKQWSKFLEMYLTQVTMRGVSEALLRATAGQLTGIELSVFIEELGTKYNTTYDKKGLENSTYQRYFSKYKNLPPFQENENEDGASDI